MTQQEQSTTQPQPQPLTHERMKQVSGGPRMVNDIVSVTDEDLERVTGGLLGLDGTHN